MEDILASIRRILNEDDPNQAAAREAAEHRGEPSDVFALDASMMVPDPVPHQPPPAGASPAPPESSLSDLSIPEPPMARTPAAEMSLPSPRPSEPEPMIEAPMVAPPPEPEKVPPSWPAGLVAPEAAAAAATSVGSLRRALDAGRAQLAVRNGGPTLEDMVREELRPVLKGWLDANLPPMVERLVRAEIERLVGRSDL